MSIRDRIDRKLHRPRPKLERLTILHPEKLDTPVSVEVEAHLPDAQPDTEFDSLENLVYHIDKYLALHGFLRREPPNITHSSWHWKALFKSRKSDIEREASYIYEELKEAVRRREIDKYGAENFEKRAKAASDLLKSLGSYDNAIVRLGEVVIAKAVIEGTPKLAIETISPAMARAFEANPKIIADPVAYFEWCASHRELRSARHGKIVGSK